MGVDLHAGPQRWPVATVRAWVAAAGLLAGCGILLAQAAPGLDRAVFLLVHHAAREAPAALWWAGTLSVLGLGTAMVLLAAAGGPASSRVLASMLASVIAGGLAVQALKHGLQVPRPLAVLGPADVQVLGMALTSRAMPSGHAAAAFALLTCVAMDPAGRPRALALAFALALGVAWARLAAGVHWPSDVLVGAGLGIAIALLVCATARTRPWLDAVVAAMHGRSGSRVTAALVVVVVALAWTSEREQPAADAAYAALGALGLLSALAWWRLHAGHGRSGPQRAAVRAADTSRP